MARKLTKDEINKKAEFFAQEMLDEDSENAEEFALAVFKSIKTNTPKQVAIIMICSFGINQAKRIAELMVEIVKARTKNV